MFRPLSALAVLVLLTGWPLSAAAAPDYAAAFLDVIYPAGGQRGQSVTVHFTTRGPALKGADGLVIDGPPGVTFDEFRPIDDSHAQATLHIAADAVPGRRMIRIKGGTSGLTNFRYFVVGSLPEHSEGKNNDDLAHAEEVAAPLVINGRVDPVLDQDCFRFQARAGQTLVAAVSAHRLDSMGHTRNTAGFADTSLELLDESGRIVADASDSIGLDPVIEYEVPSDGWYTIRVLGMGYEGFREAIYRLTLGEVPYPTAIFPPGGRRGTAVEVELFGPNIPPGTRQTVQVSADPLPTQHVTIEGEFAGVNVLPFVRGDLAEAVEAEPNNAEDHATPLQWPATVNARIDEMDDVDWYRLDMKKGQAVSLVTMSQRYLDTACDLRLDVYDEKGDLVADNDDGERFARGSDETHLWHDFVPFDSARQFTAKRDGAYYVKISEQAGVFGPRAVYRLGIEERKPDFQLLQYPDAVPVWGPGSTASFIVAAMRVGNLKADIDLSIEGLPAGWSASKGIIEYDASDRRYRPPNADGRARAFMTITAPADAEPGTVVTFQVVGRAQLGERVIERVAESRTLYNWTQPFRSCGITRAVVTRPDGPWLETEITELQADPGATIDIPITVHNAEGPVQIVVNSHRGSMRCSFQSPMPVTPRNGKAVVPLKIGKKAPGDYDIVVALGWPSDTRKGVPGPCTALIHLHVGPKGPKN